MPSHQVTLQLTGQALSVPRLFNGCRIPFRIEIWFLPRIVNIPLSVEMEKSREVWTQEINYNAPFKDGKCRGITNTSNGRSIEQK